MYKIGKISIFDKAISQLSAKESG